MGCEASGQGWLGGEVVEKMGHYSRRGVVVLYLQNYILLTVL